MKQRFPLGLESVWEDIAGRKEKRMGQLEKLDFLFIHSVILWLFIEDLCGQDTFLSLMHMSKWIQETLPFPSLLNIFLLIFWGDFPDSWVDILLSSLCFNSPSCRFLCHSPHLLHSDFLCTHPSAPWAMSGSRGSCYSHLWLPCMWKLLNKGWLSGFDNQ